MALSEEFIDIMSRKGTFKKNDIFAHVLVGDKVKKGGKRFYCMCVYILKGMT